MVSKHGKINDMSSSDNILATLVVPFTTSKQVITLFKVSDLQGVCNVTADGGTQFIKLTAESADSKKDPLSVEVCFWRPNEIILNPSANPDLERIVLITDGERRTFGELRRSEDLAGDIARRAVESYVSSFLGRSGSTNVKITRKAPVSNDPERPIPAVGRVMTYEYEKAFELRVEKAETWNDVFIGLVAL